MREHLAAIFWAVCLLLLCVSNSHLRSYSISSCHKQLHIKRELWFCLLVFLVAYCAALNCSSESSGSHCSTACPSDIWLWSHFYWFFSHFKPLEIGFIMYCIGRCPPCFAIGCNIKKVKFAVRWTVWIQRVILSLFPTGLCALTVLWSVVIHQALVNLRLAKSLFRKRRQEWMFFIGEGDSQFRFLSLVNNGYNVIFPQKREQMLLLGGLQDSYE